MSYSVHIYKTVLCIEENLKFNWDNACKVLSSKKGLNKYYLYYQYYSFTLNCIGLIQLCCRSWLQSKLKGTLSNPALCWPGLAPGGKPRSTLFMWFFPNRFMCHNNPMQVTIFPVSLIWRLIFRRLNSLSKVTQLIKVELEMAGAGITAQVFIRDKVILLSVYDTASAWHVLLYLEIWGQGPYCFYSKC